MDVQGIKMVGIMKPRIHVNTVQGRYAYATWSGDIDSGFGVMAP